LLEFIPRFDPLVLTDEHRTCAMLLISPTMNLERLMAQMGPDASKSDALKMREILVTRYVGRFAEEIPDDRWFSALDYAFAAAQERV
jgi:hypothetical protein